MDWSGPWWLLVLVFALALLIGCAVYAARTRRSGLISAAALLGLKPLQSPNPFSTEEKKGFNLFSRGYGGKWINLLADIGEPPSVLFFDFSYRFGLRLIASRKYYQSVAAFSARLTSLPDFQLTPATTLERIAPKLGLLAIQFESRPEFGKKYWLRASNEIAIRALFNDTFIDRLSSTDPRAAWYVEKSGGWLLVYLHGKSCAPAGLPRFIEASRAMAGLFLSPH